MSNYSGPDTDRHMVYRQLRKEFMVAALKTGREVLNHINDTDPELAKKLRSVFRNEGSAAYFLMTDADASSGMPPLLELARGERERVMKRLDNYKPMHLRR